MATFAKQLFCFFVMVLYTSFQTESRGIKFFSKYDHPKKDVLSSSPTPAPQPITSHISYVPTQAPIGANYDSTPAPAPETLGSNHGLAPAPAPETFGANYGPTLAPVPAPSTLGSDNSYVEGENNWYYGLYAKGTENSKFSTEFSTENPVLSNIGFPSEQKNVFDEDREENGYLNNLSDENGFWNSNHKGYKSDKNYYNVDRSNYSPMGHELARENNYEEGYYNGNYGKSKYDVDRNNYSPTGHELARENNYEEGYYNGNYGKSKYEFDSMEEYEKQEGYADVQREFIP
ncbi:hypothetical protein CDL12_15088 [Handroanthus impetiginosus]|uniref:Protein E6-like n=1 Tax=Handroanthus impetiginosus TaxID=429701 RepID=A0A2G9H474_9LAMI|nr:hypothetical protein CDL12_15088 [Handroanthus impetiginosus]